MLKPSTTRGWNVSGVRRPEEIEEGTSSVNNASDMSTPDPERGRQTAQELRSLGVKGVLLQAAEQGYITELACQMPECFCPEELGGRKYFEAVASPMPGWAPNHEHHPVPRREGGQRTPENSLLAHVLCNRIDYSIKTERPHEKDLDRVKKARDAAIERQADSP